MILTDAAMCIPNAGIYEFGILESNVHMAWMRAIGGRIKSDYRYSKDIVYNNFPWPTPNEQQKPKLNKPRKRFWTHALFTRTAALPTCMMN